MRKSTPVVAIDLAKDVFEVAVSRVAGVVSQRNRLSRSKLLAFFAQREQSKVIMEACGSAHHWARQLKAMGFEVVLLPPSRVRPYRVGNKTDKADAKALLEAYRNAEVSPVPIKTVTQQAMMGLHRLRDSWVRARTARINTVRGILRELGHVLSLGAGGFAARVHELLAAEQTLPGPLRVGLADACLEIEELSERIEAVGGQIEQLGTELPAVEHLLSVPGIGPLTATALAASVGEVQRFRSGRHFASYFGLTPREHSSGKQRILGRITKRGNRYLRTLLVHGGRSLLAAGKRAKHPSPLQRWGLDLEQRAGRSKAAVALGNKIARRAWAVWSEQRLYRRRPAA